MPSATEKPGPEEAAAGRLVGGIRQNTGRSGWMEAVQETFDQSKEGAAGGLVGPHSLLINGLLARKAEVSIEPLVKSKRTCRHVRNEQ